MSDIAQRVLQGDRRSISRAMSLIENDAPSAKALMRDLYPHTGKADIIGVTGPPGVGKSTLVDAIIAEARQRGLSVGVVAVDPSSPFTGGALLGDRIRMQRHTMDTGVFVRSLASRGRVGGLSESAASVSRVLDAAGKDIVLVETVGAGQSEVEIMRLAHTVLVVLTPGLGDDIQAIKAGILEIADIMVVNKSDLGGADRTVRELEMAIDLRCDDGWRPPVIRVIARQQQGTGELLDRIHEHTLYLRESGMFSRRLERSARAALQQIVSRRLSQAVGGGDDWPSAADLVESMVERNLDPHSAADLLLRRFARQIRDGAEI